MCLHKKVMGNFKEHLNKHETKEYFWFQIYKFPFIFYFHFLCNMKIKCWIFDSYLTTWDLNRNYCSFFMLYLYQKSLLWLNYRCRYRTERCKKKLSAPILVKYFFCLATKRWFMLGAIFKHSLQNQCTCSNIRMNLYVYRWKFEYYKKFFLVDNFNYFFNHQKTVSFMNVIICII